LFGGDFGNRKIGRHRFLFGRGLKYGFGGWCGRYDFTYRLHFDRGLDRGVGGESVNWFSSSRYFNGRNDCVTSRINRSVLRCAFSRRGWLSFDCIRYLNGRRGRNVARKLAGGGLLNTEFNRLN
jgi:hypothetical protein